MRFNKRSGAIAAVVTGATLVPLVAFGGVGLAKNAPSASEYQYSPGANQYKVRICHYTHSKKHPWVIINISKSALPAHQKHGDVLAPASGPCPPKVTASATTHGNSGSNGKDHGNNGHNNDNNANANANANGHGNNGHHGKP